MTESRRRIYSELVPIEELARAPILGELARRRVQLLAAVQPRDLAHALALVRRSRELDLSVGLWPLLADDAGRWLHPGNAPEFVRWIEGLLAALDANGLAPDAIVLDLEPPIFELRRLIDGDLTAARAWIARRLDTSAHEALLCRLAERGIESIAAVAPPPLVRGASSRGWQRALGTPIHLPYDTVTAMLYTSLFEGYSGGVLSREDARALLVRFIALSLAHFARRASVSLGAVGVGALGDERTYRDPSELADDVALARAAGIDDLALFDLSGVLARPPASAWLDALTETRPASGLPSQTARSRGLVAALWVTGLALDVAGR